MGDNSLISAPTIFEFFAAILIIFKVSSHNNPPGSGFQLQALYLSLDHQHQMLDKLFYSLLIS